MNLKELFKLKRISFFRVDTLFEKENMNGHAVPRIYFLYAYILREKLNPQLDLLRTGPRLELVKKNSAKTGHNE